MLLGSALFLGRMPAPEEEASRADLQIVLASGSGSEHSCFDAFHGSPRSGGGGRSGYSPQSTASIPAPGEVTSTDVGRALRVRSAAGATLPEPGQRQLAAVMFTDIVGYTAIMQADEEAARLVRSRHRAVLGDVLPAHGGTLLQYLGDGSLSIFPSAVSAVRAGVEIQRALRSQPRLPLRIGIHQGEIAFDEQGIYGDAVNIASRIQSLGSAGAVLVSGKIFDEIKNQHALPARLFGEFNLRNVARPVRVYTVLDEEIPHSSGEEGSAPIADTTSAPAPASETETLAAAPSLVERLNTGLSPDYVIQAQIDDTGEGLVFEAQDVMLERRVAVKVIRPELGTSNSIDRFLREARILANLHHPNIIAVYKAGTTGGFPYYVMEWIAGETLAAVLRRRRIARGEALGIARKLLDALSAAHSAGIIHRDVNPNNIYLWGERLILAGFSAGIVTPAETEQGPTHDASRYKPVEQSSGGLVTERADTYAAGAVIYEMLTGRSWTAGADPDKADWTGVPRSLQRSLRRALAQAPQNRWSDAARFRRGLLRPWRPRFGPKPLVIGAAALLLTALALLATRNRTRVTNWADLALLPFEVFPQADSNFANTVTFLVTEYLRDTPQLSLVPGETTQRWWIRSTPGARGSSRQIARELNARHVSRGRATRIGEGFDIRLTVIDSIDRPRLRDEFRTLSNDPTEAAREVALRLAREFLVPRADILPANCPSGNLDALLDFVNGELARYRGAWWRAAELYQSALRRDPLLAEARWQLVNVWRWMPGETPDLRPHLDTLAAGGGCRLSRLDSMLIAAQRGPPGLPRLRRYAEASAAEPRNAYAAFLYAEELFHRGAIAGYPAESTSVRLSAAAGLDPNMAPTFELLAWHHTRLGDSAEAKHAVDRVLELFEPDSDPLHVAYAPLLHQAYLERWEPQKARAARGQLFGANGAGAALQLGFAVRGALAFDLPDVQIELGRLAAAQQQAPRSWRANAHIAQAVALAALGRGEEALRQFDEATALLPMPAYRMMSAQWKTVPAAVGYPLSPDSQMARGRTELAMLARDPAYRTRAAFTLAGAAYARRDLEEAHRWHTVVGEASDSVAVRLSRLLDAWREAIQHRQLEALRISEPLLAFDAGQRHGDPFARSILHLLRGRWFQEIDSGSAARREWLWAENTDIVEWPSGVPQSAEVDWVLSTFASYLRGASTLRDGDQASACFHLGRTLRFLSGADATLRALRDSAGESFYQHCGR